MIKKINSSTGNFEEQVTDTIVLDTVPTVNSFNAVTSDGVARAVAGASGEVPQVTENDNGKVLTAIYDAGGPAVEWQEAQGETYTAGDGIEISNDEIKAKVASGTALHVGNVPVTAGSIATKDMAMTMTTGAYPVTYDEGVTPDPGNYTAKVVVTDGNSNTAVSVQACTPFFWMGIGTLSVPQNTTFDLTEGWSYSEGFDQSAMDHYNEYAFIVYNGNGDRVGVTELTGDRNDAVQEYSKEVALYSEIPAARSQDGQKFLMANSSGMPSYETVRQVPSYDSAPTATGTMVLGQSDIPNVPTWQHAGVPTPSSTAADDGKVLMVSGNQYGWHSLPASGSDEWWGGDPGRITLPEQTLRLKFKDLTYDPRNETDTTFTDHFQSITKVEDGIYDFLFANSSLAPMFSNAFKNKYLTDNEFIVVAFNFGTANYGKDKNMYSLFEGCTGLKSVYNVQDSTESQNRNGAFEQMFKNCTGLVYFSVMDKTAGNKDFRVSSVSNFSNMFEGCSSLVDCNLEVTRLAGTANCGDMFNGCISLVTGPSIDRMVSNATSMFRGCISLRGFHLNNILGAFDIPTDTACLCGNMFYGCESLESSDIPFFLYHTVSSVSYMFQGCKKMRTPPRHIKVASGVSLNAQYMFGSCWALESLPEMDYGAITNVDNMFRDCVMLPDISPLATVTWNASLTNVGRMFSQCWGIEKGLKDVYDNMAATATITSHSNTFKGCGTAFSNPDLAQIPSSWGGTGT